MGVPTEAGGPRWSAVLLAVFWAASGGLVAAFKIAAPYSLFVCPEGQNVTLTCKFLGPVTKGPHVTYQKTWYRSSRGEMQTCEDRQPIRNLTFQDLHSHHLAHHGNSSQDRVRRHGLELFSDHHGNFSITMHKLTLRDSGLYCCLMVEYHQHHLGQHVHAAMELQVQRVCLEESEHGGCGPDDVTLCDTGMECEDCGAQRLCEKTLCTMCGWGEEAPSKCIAYPPSPQESESITAAALATGACIVGILCLPLILLLVYKQRQVVSNRRAQELVRMESNTQGIENPGFESPPPAQGISVAKPKPPLSYMAQRQPSESGRHLLSEPSTPLSPPGPGDVFFPSLDPVPDSPNFEAV